MNCCILDEGLNGYVRMGSVPNSLSSSQMHMSGSSGHRTAPEA